MMLLKKTLLARPGQMREVEIDADGNIVSLAKLDFDKTNYSEYDYVEFFVVVVVEVL